MYTVISTCMPSTYSSTAILCNGYGTPLLSCEVVFCSASKDIVSVSVNWTCNTPQCHIHFTILLLSYPEYTDLKGVEDKEQPGKDCTVLVHSKQSNDPGEAHQRHQKEDGLE